MKRLTKSCPYCSGTLEIERLRCGTCGVAVEGQIAIPRLARLSAENREFIELFVRSSGSLKAVAAKLGISYPTVRGRLDRVIAALAKEEDEEQDARRDILSEVERGRMTVDDAVQLLREL